MSRQFVESARLGSTDWSGLAIKFVDSKPNLGSELLRRELVAVDQLGVSVVENTSVTLIFRESVSG